MTLSEYQDAALRTASRKPGEEVSRTIDLAALALGVAGEAGEVCDLIKKHVGHGHPLDRDKLVKELGDVLWYGSVLAYRVGVLFGGPGSERAWSDLGCAMFSPPTNIGLAEAALELADYGGVVARIVRKQLTSEHMDGLGAMLDRLYWQLNYIARAAAGVTLSAVAEANIVKLRARYPEGFTQAASLNRVAT